MKLLFIILFFTVSFFASAQDSLRLSSKKIKLLKEREKLAGKLGLRIYDSTIILAKVAYINRELYNESFSIKAKRIISVIDKPDMVKGREIIRIPVKSEFRILNFYNDFYQIDFNDIKGFVFYAYLDDRIKDVEKYKSICTKSNSSIDSLRLLLSYSSQIEECDEQISYISQRKVQVKNEKIQDEVKRNRLKEERLIELKKMFNSYDAIRILNGEIWLGMNSLMIRESIGSPKRINKSTYSDGVREQWIYDSRYLYLEDGVLNSWQEFN